MTEIKMVSKLSAKNGGVSPKKIAVLPESQKHLKLCTIVGIADGVKRVEDPVHGKVYFALRGRFEAVNAEDGEKTRSGVLYLPGGIHETYQAAVENLEEGESIRFAIELRAVRAANPAGYSYEAVDLLPVKEVDPLDDIMAAVSSAKQLASGATNLAPAPAQAKAQHAVKK